MRRSGFIELRRKRGGWQSKRERGFRVKQGVVLRPHRERARCAEKSCLIERNHGSRAGRWFEWPEPGLGRTEEIPGPASVA